MNLIEIFTILIIHYIADFVMQTDWQAKNKSSNNEALLSHTLNYTAWMTVLGMFMFLDYRMFMFGIITFVCHTITDYWTSRLNSKLWKEGRVHWFFVSVGGDQMLHYIQLFTTYWLLIK